MPYLVKWVERNTSAWGETTVDRLEQVREYLEEQGYPDEVIAEVLEDFSYYGLQSTIMVQEVPKQKPSYIVCDANGLLKIRQRLKQNSEYTPILICRSKDIAERVIQTARRVGTIRFRLPLAHKPVAQRNAIADWVREVQRFELKELSLGDVRVYKESVHE